MLFRSVMFRPTDGLVSHNRVSIAIPYAGSTLPRSDTRTYDLNAAANVLPLVVMECFMMLLEAAIAIRSYRAGLPLLLPGHALLIARLGLIMMIVLDATLTTSDTDANLNSNRTPMTTQVSVDRSPRQAHCRRSLELQLRVHTRGKHWMNPPIPFSQQMQS